MIKISVPVKHDLLDSFLNAFFGNEFTDLFRRFYVSRALEHLSHFRAQSGCACDRLPGRIHDRLGINMLQAPEDIEPRPLRRPTDLASHPLFPFESSSFL